MAVGNIAFRDSKVGHAYDYILHKRDSLAWLLLTPLQKV